MGRSSRRLKEASSTRVSRRPTGNDRKLLGLDAEGHRLHDWKLTVMGE